jgi:hypothetical protein
MSFLPTPEDTGGAFAMAIVGRRGGGKTHLCCELLKYFYRGMFDLIIWVSPTFELQEITKEFNGAVGLIVFPEWRTEIIEALFAYMFDRNSKAQQEGKSKERALLILDDVGALARKGKLSEQLDNVAFVSRNYGVSVIEIAQRPTLMTTSMSSQLDAILIFREQNPQERMNLQRRLGFGDKRAFHDTIDRYTNEKYSFIGIRNLSGRLHFFTLDGEVQSVRNSAMGWGTGSRGSGASNSRFQGN